MSDPTIETPVSKPEVPPEVTPETKPEVAPASPEPIAKELLNLKQSMRAFVTIHSLLGAGLFSRPNFDAVTQCQAFIQKLHSEAMDQALAHPDADKDEELKEEKKNVQAETQKP